MKYTSRVPRVTIRPVFAPFLSIRVLIAVVEPWISSATAAQSTPLFFRQSTMPWTSRAGVVRLFACENRPVASSNAIRSVNVPPISIATTIIPPESYSVRASFGHCGAHCGQRLLGPQGDGDGVHHRSDARRGLHLLGADPGRAQHPLVRGQALAAAIHGGDR